MFTAEQQVEIVHKYIGTECVSCGYKKKSGLLFCNWCYFQLDPPSKRKIHQPLLSKLFLEGYKEALECLADGRGIKAREDYINGEYDPDGWLKPDEI